MPKSKKPELKTEQDKKFYGSLEKLDKIVIKYGGKDAKQQYDEAIIDWMNNWLDKYMKKVEDGEMHPMVLMSAMLNISEATKFTATKGLNKLKEK